MTPEEIAEYNKAADEYNALHYQRREESCTLI